MSRVVFISVAVMAWFGAMVPYAQAGLVGHWDFDNSSNVGQASVSDDLLAVGSAAYSSSAKIGSGALSLDGTGDYLAKSGGALPMGLPLGDSNFTVAVWLKLDASADPIATGYGMVGWGSYGTSYRVNAFRTGNSAEVDQTYRDAGEGTTPTDFDYGIGHYSWGGYPDIFRGADGQASRPDIDDGGWHLAIVTYDSLGANLGAKTLFVDALQLGASKSIETLNVQSGGFRIGSTNNGEYFLGLLDDVAIWDRALTVGEIKALYDLASSVTYGYDAKDTDALLSAHSARSSGVVVIDGTAWAYRDGLAGDAGLSVDGMTLVIDSSAGTGMTVVPEPGSFGLLGLGLAFVLRRTRRSRLAR